MNHRAVDGPARGDNGGRADAGISKQTDEFTGRYLVLLDPDSSDQALAALESGAGVARTQRVPGRESTGAAELLDRGDSVLFEELGVAVVDAAPDQREALATTAREHTGILSLERERTVYASQMTRTAPETATADYLRGYQDGVEELVQHALERLEPGAAQITAEARRDETHTTWGLQATRVAESTLSGAGVNVAVLDTGVALEHPDLVGRFGGTSSFVPGEDVDDGNGHGTHCIGTSCGPLTPAVLPRYGVAYEAQVFAGKVLGNQGSGTDTGILAGMNWAVAAGCRIASMSLGAPTDFGQPFSQVYEHAARRALRAGTLIVAAAGNESTRPDDIRPVGHPANCPSILAVGALTEDLTVAFFSCAGFDTDGGQVDLAAPGVDILSSWPESGYRRLMGTSMATPHVAGICALFAEANPDASAAEIKSLLLAGARRLPLPAVDVGVGLVQAP
ncbi:S8 family peptidase [Yinghuangia sp. YIM S10712]|uniref:S8 family peptidase n=1 Tax=Yinghuangia sp. YIM S10712 TaxID=3436930 RepID=UPI003F52D953